MVEAADMSLAEFQRKAEEKHKAPVPPATITEPNECSDDTCVSTRQSRGISPAEQNTINGRLLYFYERNFWRTLSVIGEPPLYGADMCGSLFGTDEASNWN